MTVPVTVRIGSREKDKGGKGRAVNPGSRQRVRKIIEDVNGIRGLCAFRLVISDPSSEKKGCSRKCLHKPIVSVSEKTKDYRLKWWSITLDMSCGRKVGAFGPSTHGLVGHHRQSSDMIPTGVLACIVPMPAPTFLRAIAGLLIRSTQLSQSDQ